MSKSFASAELKEDFGLLCVCLALTWLLQEVHVKSVLANVIRKFLDLSFWPAFDATKELTLVTLIEVFDGLFKFNLRRSQRVNLHKLLQVKERL
jgi:predicted nucleic acid binding AN1-type Zn finger protein